MTNEDYQEIGKMFVQCLADADPVGIQVRTVEDIGDFLQSQLEDGSIDEMKYSWFTFATACDELRRDEVKERLGIKDE